MRYVYLSIEESITLKNLKQRITAMIENIYFHMHLHG